MPPLDIKISGCVANVELWIPIDLLDARTEESLRYAEHVLGDHSHPRVLDVARETDAWNRFIQMEILASRALATALVEPPVRVRAGGMGYRKGDVLFVALAEFASPPTPRDPPLPPLYIDGLSSLHPHCIEGVKVGWA